MREEFLHFIWLHKRFTVSDLQTTDGQSVEIQHVGLHNSNAGPDFIDARIKLNDTLWAGNIEIHTKTSDWTKHQHSTDPAYANLILHVVYEDDAPEFTATAKFPTLVLKDEIDLGLYQKYQSIIKNTMWIPCANLLDQLNEFQITSGFDRLVVERLIQKAKFIEERLTLNQDNWEETFYQMIARNLGLKINMEPFDLMARSLPQKIIAKHKDQPHQIEALLYGQAGFLDQDYKDEYPNKLKEEYAFLSQKYHLQPIPLHLWKFMRLRPTSFPTIRLGQLSALLHQSAHLFSKVIKAENPKEIIELFQVKASKYWDTHYRFDTESTRRSKKLGESTIQLLIINTIAPFLFVYALKKGNDQYKTKALELLEALKPEQNSILKNWNTFNISSKNAFDSQALIQLKRAYCEQLRCLDCHIGCNIMQR